VVPFSIKTLKAKNYSRTKTTVTEGLSLSTVTRSTASVAITIDSVDLADGTHSAKLGQC
jgi:hypothetical protein